MHTICVPSLWNSTSHDQLRNQYLAWFAVYKGRKTCTNPKRKSDRKYQHSALSDYIQCQFCSCSIFRVVHQILPCQTIAFLTGVTNFQTTSNKTVPELCDHHIYGTKNSTWAICQADISGTEHIWGFPKIGVPQDGWFIVDNPIEMIGVAITQGIMVPGFCKYNSDFRPVNYKSKLRFKKKHYKYMSQSGMVALQKYNGFIMGFSFFFNVFFFVWLGPRFPRTFVGHCWRILW